MRFILAALITIGFSCAALAENHPIPFGEFTTVAQQPADSTGFVDGELYYIAVTCDFDNETEWNQSDPGLIDFPALRLPSGGSKIIKQIAYGIGWQGVTRIGNRVSAVFGEAGSALTVGNISEASADSDSFSITPPSFSFTPVLAFAGRTGSIQQDTSGLSNLCRQNSGFFFRYDQTNPPMLKVIGVSSTESHTDGALNFVESVLEAAENVVTKLAIIVPGVNTATEDRDNIFNLAKAVETFLDLFKGSKAEIFGPPLRIGTTLIGILTEAGSARKNPNYAIRVIISDRDVPGREDNLFLTGPAGLSSNWRDFIRNEEYYGLRVPFDEATTTHPNTCNSLRDRLTEAENGVPNRDKFLLKAPDAAYIMLAALTQLGMSETHAFLCLRPDLLREAKDYSSGNYSNLLFGLSETDVEALSDQDEVAFNVIQPHLDDTFLFSDFFNAVGDEQNPYNDSAMTTVIDAPENQTRGLPELIVAYETERDRVKTVDTTAQTRETLYAGVYALSNRFEHLDNLITALRFVTRDGIEQHETTRGEIWADTLPLFSDNLTVTLDPLFILDRLDRIDEINNALNTKKETRDTKQAEHDTNPSPANASALQVEIADLEAEIMALESELTFSEGWNLQRPISENAELETPGGSFDRLYNVFTDLGIRQFGCGVLNITENQISGDAQERLFGHYSDNATIANFFVLAQTDKAPTNIPDVLITGYLAPTGDDSATISALSISYMTPGMRALANAQKSNSVDAGSCVFN